MNNNILDTFTKELNDSLPYINKSFIINNILNLFPELNESDSFNIVFLKRRKIKYNGKYLAQKISILSYYKENNNDYETDEEYYI